jgi:LemA protein
MPGKDLALIEGQLAAALSRLVVRLEAYPTLKADQSFLALQAELANTEDRIQGALRFYNGNVRELNVKCESFPSNLIASMFGFATANYFELKDSAERAVPLVAP